MIYCYFITGLQIRYQPKRFLLATDIFSSRELVAKSTRLDNVNAGQRTGDNNALTP